jgi:hypothetical protein
MAIRAISSGATLENALRSGCFLIADVRGYTLFTQERGDEAATKLRRRAVGRRRDRIRAPESGPDQIHPPVGDPAQPPLG